MNTRSWVCLLLVASSICLRASAAEARPNIIFIYADDLRWDALGSVQRERGDRARFPFIQTPRLDQFAAQSLRFRESFVATSLCSPGRANVMTSRYGHHTGIIGNSLHLPPQTVTFAQQLRGIGYETAYCGKWHMRDQRDRPHYDYVASFVGQGRYFDCPMLVNGRETPTQGWVDDVSTDYAIQFLEKQSRAKPFFLWLGFKSPHGPRGGDNLPERVKSLYANAHSRPTPNTALPAIYTGPGTESPGLRRNQSPGQIEVHRDYLRHVTAIDDCIGRVLDALDRTGRANETLVIVTSDNGYYLGEHGLGDKRSAYDESLRVPLLIRPPGRISAANRVRDAMVLNLDHGPTILDYAGAAPLPDAQGRSLRPVVEERVPADWRQAYFYEYFREANFGAPTVLAVRTTTHKLVMYPGHEDWTELFDLENDPYETKNLVTNSTLLMRLKTMFGAERSASGFRWPAGFGPDGETFASDRGRKNAVKKKKRN